MPKPDGTFLDPLPDEAFDGEKIQVELNTSPCKHDIYVISSAEVRCRKCQAGWTGPNAYLLAKE